MTDKTDRKLLEQALEALYSAPLDHNSIKSRFFERRHHAIIALRERLARPEQEPVAGVVIREGLPTLLQDRYIKSTDQRLYTAPQQREWQGLTNEEISAISKSIPGGTEVNLAKRLFAREIEDKLKEKNT